jgi:hypothetical protein
MDHSLDFLVTSFTVPTVNPQYTAGNVNAVKFPDVKPVGGGDDNHAPTQVSTEALKTYSANLRTLAGALKQVEAKLTAAASQPVEPGYFYEANQLVTRVNGTTSSSGAGTTGGVVPVTKDFVTKLVTALTTTADNLDQLAAKYTKAEDLNNVSAQKLNDLISTAESSISAVTGSPVSLTPVPGAAGSSGGK